MKTFLSLPAVICVLWAVTIASAWMYEAGYYKGSRRLVRASWVPWAGSSVILVFMWFRHHSAFLPAAIGVGVLTFLSAGVFLSTRKEGFIAAAMKSAHNTQHPPWKNK